MTFPAPSKVIIEPADERFVDITFFSPSYPPATARYPRDEIAKWVARWLKVEEK